MRYIAKSPVKISHVSEFGENDSYYLNEASRTEKRLLREAIEEDFKDMSSRGLADYLQFGNSERQLLDQVVESIIVDIDDTQATTVIKTSRELTERELKVLEGYLIGQFSDGWGEGFEQRGFNEYTSNSDEQEYDEETGELVTEEVEDKIEVYANFWQGDSKFKMVITEG